MEYDVKTFGRNMRIRRAALGISQTKLAEKSGISDTTLCQYELGNHTPNLASAIKIANALEISLDALLDADTFGKFGR